MLKKFMSFLLVLVLVFGLIVNPYTTKAEQLTESNIILTKDKDQYNIGDTVNITIEGQGNNIYGIQFILNYDPNFLKLKDDGITYLESFLPFVKNVISDGKIQFALTNQTSQINTNNKIVKFSFVAQKKGALNVQLLNIKAMKNVNNQYPTEMNTNASYDMPVTINEVEANRIEIENSKSMAIGDTVKLNAVIYPENATYKNIKWSSSNTSVAVVDESGNVKAIATGQADITVASVEYPNVTAKCSIYVKNNIADLSSITVNGISLSDFSKEKADYDVMLPAGTTTATVAATAVDKNAVVTITQAAALPGKATIEVKSEDGKVTKTVTLNISVIKVPVTGVSINKKSLKLELGNSDMLTAKLEPKNATNSEVVWSSSKPDVVYVDSNGNITAKATGIAVITVTTKDGSYSDNCVVTVPVDKKKFTDVIKDAADTGKTEVVVPQDTISDGSVPVSLDQIQAGQDKDLSFVFNIGSVEISVPSNAIDISKYTSSPENSSLVISQVPTNSEQNIPNGFKLAGKSYEITMSIIDENGKITEIHNFDNREKVKLTIHLTEEELSGLNINKLAAYYFNINSNKWEEIKGGTFDKATSNFTFETSHFTEFAVMESANNTGAIPKTGSVFDLTTVVFIGLLLTGTGIVLVGWKRHNKTVKNS